MEEPRNATRPTLRHLAIVLFILALVAGSATLAAGPGARWGWWNYREGLSILRMATYAGIVVGILSALGCAIAWAKGNLQGLAWSAAGLLIVLTVIFLPWSMSQRSHRVPAIHDITTDTDHPPQFVALLPVRQASANKAAYGGPEIAARQRAAYPDIVPFELSRPADQAVGLAADAARVLGWQIVEVNKTEGRIEATDTTFWFGFKDDIVVRVTPTARGSRIDVRSVSRVGRSDLGTNARRIRGYLKKVDDLAKSPATTEAPACPAVPPSDFIP